MANPPADERLGSRSAAPELPPPDGRARAPVRPSQRTRSSVTPLTVLAAAIPLALLSHGFILEKVLDLALEIRLAEMWGTSVRRDMYLVASIALIPAGMMQMVAIPLIVDLRRRGVAEDGRALLGSLTAVSLYFTVFTAGLAMAVWWSAGGTNSVSAAEMVSATAAFAVAGVGMTLVAIAAADHVADGRFGLVSLRLPLIRAAMLAAAFTIPFGIAAPAAGALLSSIPLTVVVWMRSDLSRWLRRPDFSRMAAAAGLLAMNAYPIVPRLLIERPVLGALGDGTLATLDFAEKTTVILGLAGFAIVGVATAALSAGDSTYRKRAVFVVLLLAPVAVAVAVFSDVLVSILFERGEFVAADSVAVSELTRYLAPSIPFVAALPLLVPGVRAAGALSQGVALVAVALLAHLGVTIFSYWSGDPRLIAVGFDISYVALFAGFFALAKARR